MPMMSFFGLRFIALQYTDLLQYANDKAVAAAY